MATKSLGCQAAIAFHSVPTDCVTTRKCHFTLCVRRNSHRLTARSDEEHSVSTNEGRKWRIQSSPLSAPNGTISILENGALTAEESPSAFKDNAYVGYGRLLPDRTFRERFVIRFSEVSSRGKISIETLSSLLQEAASNHVHEMDYSFSPGKNMGGNITVTTRMHIEVDKYPEWRDLIEIDTWFQPEGKHSVRRDWIVKDVQTGENIAFATSTWVLVNSQTRRLTKITEERWEEIEPHMVRSPLRWALSEDRRKGSLAKIAKLDAEAAFKTEGVVASEKDCDMNQHVNNVKYLGWMIETVPEEIRRSHEIAKLTIEYRQEANHGERVNTLANTENLDSSAVIGFTHLTVKDADAKEVNRGRTVWRLLTESES
ncbi:hypothetical protein R1sor_007432 [Riccia sorocarpa]|uniref:Acyl-[acyl-carrier-protein] hydrolase n=1 Tax=Riccia sorocarpa TaxID=122646 RepID=A0ABD3HS49_9MARC